MAKKKTPKKFRQARAEANADAKKVFTGKKQAARRDPSLKYSADDVKALKEVAEETKKGYITDDRGQRINVKPDETARERIARENKEAMRKFRERVEMEDGPQKTEPSKKVEASKKFTKKAAPAKKAAAPKKAAVKSTKTFGEISKAVTGATKPGTEKKMTRAERSTANKERWAKSTPEERKNWNKGKTEPAKPGVKKAAAPKAAPAPKEPITKRPTLASLKKNEAKALEEAKARVAAKNKALANSAKGKTQTPQAEKAKATAKPEGKAPAKKAAAAPKKFRKTKAAAKGGAYAAIAGELVSLARGSTKKDFDEINRLENKLAQKTGKGKSKATAARQGAQMQASNLAALATMGIVGKTRRQRMDELNNLISKADAKKAKANKGLRYGKDGSSLVPGTAAYKAGSKTRPTATQPTAGGSTTKVTEAYTVKKGDTLSGIAKNAGVSLSQIREANPSIMKNKKYKQGSMIWSGTKVRIPKK
jgi:LysM repeat protein